MRILIGANTQKNELIVLDKKITSKRQIKMENEYLKKFDYQNEIYFEEDKNPYFEMEHYIEDEEYMTN